jgi:hypothetical protein
VLEAYKAEIRKLVVDITVEECKEMIEGELKGCFGRVGGWRKRCFGGYGGSGWAIWDGGVKEADLWWRDYDIEELHNDVVEANIQMEVMIS